MQKERLSHTISAVIYSLSLVSDFHLRMKHFIVHTIFLDLSGRYYGEIVLTNRHKHV